MRRLVPSVRSAWFRLLRERSGVSAVEFALIAPVFLLLVAGTIDLGGMLQARFALNSAISAGANYALVNGADLKQDTASTLADAAAVLLAGSSSEATIVSVQINDGYTATRAGGVASSSGATSSADKCFCPMASGSGVAWGSAVACASSCANGAIAGKFVTLVASRPFSPMFSGYGIVDDGMITVTTVVQAQ